MGFPDDIGIIDCGVGFPYSYAAFFFSTSV